MNIVQKVATVGMILGVIFIFNSTFAIAYRVIYLQDRSMPLLLFHGFCFFFQWFFFLWQAKAYKTFRY